MTAGKQKMKIRMAIWSVLCMGAGFSACSKGEETVNLDDGVSTVIRDLPGDTLASMESGGNFKTLYFDFGTASAVTVSDDEKASGKWDLAFTGPYNCEVYVNCGVYEPNPGYGGTGKGAVIIMESPYDRVDEAPANAEFDASDFYKIGWDTGSGRGWFFYSLENHICVPVKNRTFAIRTKDGKFGKLELINIYKGNPPVVTDLFWPAPYLTFRYWIQQDGSRNIKTR